MLERALATTGGSLKHAMRTPGPRSGGLSATTVLAAAISATVLTVSLAAMQATRTRAVAGAATAAPRSATTAQPAAAKPAGAEPAGAAGGGVHTEVGGPGLTRPGVIVNYPSPHSPRLPKLPAGAFVLADAATGQVLAAKQPHAQFGPASTLKILAAISLIPVLNPNAAVLASKRAVSVEPNVVGLKLGHPYKISDLFRALLLISGNDAAIALAEATGSFGKGVALMNAEAHRLQAYDTVARQPNGLDAPGQHVSAYDEALIARQALRMPTFLAYDQTPVAWFPITQRHRIELFNQDQLLTTYPGFLGGKTGWTTPAMATYVGMARRNGHTLIVTLLHAVPGTLFRSATAMLDWGFRMDGKIAPVGQLVSPLPAVTPAPPRHGAQPRQAAKDAATSSSGGLAGWLAASGVALAALALGGYRFTRRRRGAGS
jgi:serine-type D-Ala-D-Ala carboxypeptidase (penicillin-binding protein 5/6)